MARSDELTQVIEKSSRTALGMATRFVLDAAYELALEQRRPFMLIASRRQVESEAADGGYIGWSTSEWCRAAQRRAAGSMLLLCRDHGGPYQHPRDLAGGNNSHDPMRFAMDSLATDISSGVNLLHIDASGGPGGVEEEPEIALSRTLELISFAVDTAALEGREVAFEVGLEVQTETIAEKNAFERYLETVLPAIERECNVVPAFVVAQTGTKVSGSTNIGLLANARDRAVELPNLVGLCRKFGTRLKAHNCDYLDSAAIAELRRAGAWMNISPELGLAQVRVVLAAGRAAGLNEHVDTFCEAVLAAGQWRRWIGSDSGASDAEKVLLGGSYLFATPKFLELSQRLDRALASKSTSTAEIAVEAVKSVVRRFESTPVEAIDRT